MKQYLFIESEAAFGAAGRSLALARDLAAHGAKVEIMLVQNAVMSARAGAKAEALGQAIKAGIAVWADDFAMKERALARGQLARGVNPAALGTVIERMAGDWNVIWN